jgi:hypothetical protein
MGRNESAILLDFNSGVFQHYRREAVILEENIQALGIVEAKAHPALATPTGSNACF